MDSISVLEFEQALFKGLSESRKKIKKLEKESEKEKQGKQNNDR